MNSLVKELDGQWSSLPRISVELTGLVFSGHWGTMVDQGSVAWSTGPRESILIVKTNSRPKEIRAPCFTFWSIRLDHGAGQGIKRNWPGVRTLPSIKAVCRCASVDNHRQSEQWIQYYFLTEFVTTCIQPGRYRNVKDLTRLRRAIPCGSVCRVEQTLSSLQVGAWSNVWHWAITNSEAIMFKHVQACSKLLGMQLVVWLAERTSMESTDWS